MPVFNDQIIEARTGESDAAQQFENGLGFPLIEASPGGLGARPTAWLIVDEAQLGYHWELV